MQVESAKSRLRGPKILCRERFETVPYWCTLQQACPVLDTTKDEGNPAKRGTDGHFQQPVRILIEHKRRRMSEPNDHLIEKNQTTDYSEIEARGYDAGDD